MPELDPVIHAESRLRAITTLNEVGERNRIAFTTSTVRVRWR